MLKEETVPEDVTSKIISDVNSNAVSFNDMLLSCLSFLNDVLAELEENNRILLANSTVEYILTSKLIATGLLESLELKTDSFKINGSLKDMLIINSKSILNAVELIKNIQSERIKEANPEDILKALVL